jgi:hypothetical protein
LAARFSQGVERDGLADRDAGRLAWTIQFLRLRARVWAAAIAFRRVLIFRVQPTDAGDRAIEENLAGNLLWSSNGAGSLAHAKVLIAGSREPTAWPAERRAIPGSVRSPLSVRGRM